MRITRTKLLTTVASLLLLFFLLYTPALAITEYTAGDYTYIVSQGNAAITRYSGDTEVLRIPDTLDGYPVTRICMSSFQNCKTLLSVSVPDSVISIGESVPDENGYVAPLEDFDSRPVIGWSCGTMNLRQANERSVFSGCTSLRSIYLPSNVKVIYKYAFFNCNAQVYYPRETTTEQAMEDSRTRSTPPYARPTRTPRNRQTTPTPPPADSASF